MNKNTTIYVINEEFEYAWRWSEMLKDYCTKEKEYGKDGSNGVLYSFGNYEKRIYIYFKYKKIPNGYKNIIDFDNYPVLNTEIEKILMKYHSECYKYKKERYKLTNNEFYELIYNEFKKTKMLILNIFEQAKSYRNHEIMAKQLNKFNKIEKSFLYDFVKCGTFGEWWEYQQGNIQINKVHKITSENEPIVFISLMNAKTSKIKNIWYFTNDKYNDINFLIEMIYRGLN